MIVLIGCSSKQSTMSFITVKGTQFYIGSKPYYFWGINLWYGSNLGSNGVGGDRERLVRVLDKLKSLGINNLRILGASERMSQYKIVSLQIQPKLGVYNEEVLEGLDFLLTEMAKRDMVAMIFLNNYLIWSGRMSQYVSWLEDVPVPNHFLELLVQKCMLVK